MKWIKNSKWNKALKLNVHTYIDNTDHNIRYRISDRSSNPMSRFVYWTFYNKMGKCTTEQEAQGLLISKKVTQRILGNDASYFVWDTTRIDPNSMSTRLIVDKIKPYNAIRHYSRTIK